MARIWHGGAELNSATDGVEVTTNSGAVAISSAIKRSGSYAWRFLCAATAIFCRQQVSATNLSSTGYLRAYIYITTLPGVTIQVLRFSNAANAHTASIRLTSTGTLTLNNAAGTQVGSASTALSTGTWYRLELKLNGAATASALDARLDGVSFASGNNSSIAPWSRILWGAITPNSTCDIYFDDIALNDGTGTSQNSWPGEGKLICLRPNGAGDSNQWLQTAGGAGSSTNYTLVDEATPNDATDYVQSTTLNDIDEYNVEASGLGGTDTVNVVSVSLRHANDIADATIQVTPRIKKTSGGTVTSGTPITLNSAAWITDFNGATIIPQLVTYTDPDGAAWTQSTLDTMQIGIKLSTDSANKILVSAMWAYVEYVAGAAGTLYTQGLSATATITPTLVPVIKYVKSLSATTAIVVSLSKIVTYFRILSATATITPTLARFSQFFRSLAATTSITATLARQATYFKSLAASTSITATLAYAKSFSKNLAATATITASLAKQLLKTVTLSVSATLTATLQKVANNAGTTIKNYYTGGISAAKRFLRGIGF